MRTSVLEADTSVPSILNAPAVPESCNKVAEKAAVERIQPRFLPGVQKEAAEYYRPIDQARRRAISNSGWFTPGFSRARPLCDVNLVVMERPLLVDDSLSIVSELASEAGPAGLKLGEDEAQLFEVTPEESSIAGEKCIGMNLGVGANQEVSDNSLRVVRVPRARATLTIPAPVRACKTCRLM
jgi:hypothetical protein